MEHAGGVRRGVASICDRSFDLISILGKIDFEPDSYIDTKIILSRNRFLKIDLDQTAPPKMTAMTIGWFQVFGETIELTGFLPMKSRFPRQTLISISIYNWIISSGINILGGSYIFGRILGARSRRLHLLIGAILQGKYAIEHVAEGDRQQKQTGSFPLDLEIGVGVIVFPNQTLRWGPNGRRGVA